VGLWSQTTRVPFGTAGTGSLARQGSIIWIVRELKQTEKMKRWLSSSVSPLFGLRCYSTLQPIASSTTSFQRIRKNKQVYVDKTSFLPQLLQDGNQFFLSRPRKFGKSLTLDTIGSVFMPNGKEKDELFDGLWIKENAPELLKQELPVLHLDLSRQTLHKGGEQFETDLHQTICREGKKKGISGLEQSSLALAATDLVIGLAEQTPANKIVLLIDEYDAPITSVLNANGGNENKLAVENRTVLQGFFAVLKSLDPFIHFQLVVGVSKFAKTALFSGANQLEDITLDPQFSSLLGYTWSDVSIAFAKHLTKLAQVEGKTTDDLQKDITDWYNGYSLESVYNPSSLGMLFHKMAFRGYWTTQATPGWLLRVLTVDDLQNLTEQKDKLHPIEGFSKFELESLGRTAFDTTNLLFQTGYLSVKEIEKADDSSTNLRLDFPNYEIKKSFLSESFKQILETSFTYTHLESLRHALDKTDMDKFYKLLDKHFRSVPHTVFKKSSSMTNTESFYSAVLAFALSFLPPSYRIDAEQTTSDGSMDLVIETPTFIIINEFKVVRREGTKKGPTKEELQEVAKTALKQIEDKQYASKYEKFGKSVLKVGVAFDAYTGRVGFVHTK